MSFFEDFKRPFNIFTTLLAIGSIILGIYFYYNPKKDKKLSYIITEPQQIFDSKISSPKITVLDAARKHINQNIYVVTVTLWNSGSEPIEPQDNRKPFTFKINKGYQILDCKILKEKDPAVSMFDLSTTNISQNASDRVMQLNWKHFDPRQGLSFQLIFTASANYSLGFDSNVLGLESISDARPISKRYSIIGTLISFLIGILIPFVLELSVKIFRMSKSRKRYLVISMVILVAALAIFVLYALFLRGDSPPF